MPSVPLWYLAFLRFPFDRTFRITGATFVLITFVPLPFVRFPLGFFRLAFALASSFGQCECTFKTEHQIFYFASQEFCNTEPALWSSFRLISISQLHTLLHFHL